MSKVAEMQRVYRHYKDSTQRTEVAMHDVVDFAVTQGWPLPKPIDPRDRLAKEFSEAVRQEIRYDRKTSRPYRANHAVTEMRSGTQTTFWFDIDEAPRPKMHKSMVQRREQIVGDALQMSLDMDHWNSVNLSEEPIALPLDFEFDVQLRKMGSGDMDEAS